MLRSRPSRAGCAAFKLSLRSSQSEVYCRGMLAVLEPVSAVVADGFDGAAEEGFFAERGLGFGLRLFEDEGVAAAIVACEVCARGVAAHVAVNAVRVHVVRAGR